MSKSSRRDYFWNTLGVLAQNAISPILLVVVTRVNGVYESGIFSYALAVALIFWAFGIWGGRTYQVSDLRQEYTPHGYLMVRLLLGVAVLAVSVLFCIANGYDLQKSSIIIVFVLFKILESISDAVYGVVQKGGKLFIAGRSLFIKAVIGSVVFIVTDIVTGSLLWAALSLVLVNIVVLMLYDTYHARNLQYSVTGVLRGLGRYSKEAVDIIKRCSPIAAVIFLSMFSLNIPRYFIDRFHIEELGYFGILAMPITVLALFITFLLQPKIISLTEIFLDRRYDELQSIIKRIMLSVVGLGVLGLALTYLIGVPVLSVIFGLDFRDYKLELVIVVVGAIMNAIVSVYINIFTIIRHFKALFYTLVATNLGLVVLSIYIVHEYSLLGAVALYAVVNLLQAAILHAAYKVAIESQRSRDSRLQKT